MVHVFTNLLNFGVFTILISRHLYNDVAQITRTVVW
jgi:hypothetical protein